MVSSPTLARSRAISSSRSSAGRLFSAAWPPARKSSRQPERVAAVTPSSRESEFQVFAAEEAEDGRRSCAGRRSGHARRGSGCWTWVWAPGSGRDDVPTGCPTEPRSGGLVVSLANTGEPLSLVNRSGNRPSHEHAAEHLLLGRSPVPPGGGFSKITLPRRHEVHPDRAPGPLGRATATASSSASTPWPTSWTWPSGRDLKYSELERPPRYRSRRSPARPGSGKGAVVAERRTRPCG